MKKYMTIFAAILSANVCNVSFGIGYDDLAPGVDLATSAELDTRQGVISQDEGVLYSTSIRESGAPTEISKFQVQTDRDQPILTFLFDDGLRGLYENKEVFTTNNAFFGLGTTIDLVGTAGYVTWDEIDELVHTDKVMQVFAHTKTHDYTPWDTQSVTGIYNEVHGAMAVFREHGYAPELFVHPGSRTGGALGVSIVSEIHPYAIQTTRQWTQYDDPFAIWDDLEAPESLTRYYIQDGVSLSNCYRIIDLAVSNGRSLILAGHQLIDGVVGDEGALDVSTEKIEAIINYARAAGMKLGYPSEYLNATRLPKRLGGVFCNRDGVVHNSAANLKEGLALWLGMEQGGLASGSFAYDSSTSGTDAALTGSPSWGVGDYGRSITLTGSEYAALATPVTLTNWTFSALLNKSTAGTAEFIAGITGSNFPYIYWNGALSRFEFFTDDPSGTTITVSDLADYEQKWTFLTIVSQAERIKLYLDGEYKGAVDQAAGDNGAMSFQQFGGRQGNGSFVGELGWVIIHDRVLTSTEIKNLNDGLLGTPTGHLSLK